MEKYYCEECRLFVGAKEFTNVVNKNIEGFNINYLSKTLKCNICGCHIFSAAINDFNVTSMWAELRKKKNIVSLDIIRDIPKKYNIGKRNLSIILGWGEITFTRYYNGSIPTKTYSDILVEIYENPQKYYNLLEENKFLIEKSAYEKSLSSKKINSKIEIVANYLLTKSGDITPLALQKSLYYAQGFNYIFSKNDLFENDCEAWVHGPVYKLIFDKYKSYKYNSIYEEKMFCDVLNLDEKKLLDEIVNSVCCYGGKILEKITHNEEPWIKTKQNNIIKKETISNFFNKIKVEYKIEKIEDINNYMTKQFKKFH